MRCEFAFASRHGGPLALIFLDIDHFKKINDCFGHDVGDEVLREFAVRLASNVRAMDLPVRFGGEEFVVVMPDTELDHALKEVDRAAQATARTAEQVVDVLRYVIRGELPG